MRSCPPGHEPTVESVQRSRKPLKIRLVGVRCHVDVLGIEPPAVGLNRGSPDQHERHVVADQLLEQRLALGVSRSS